MSKFVLVAASVTLLTGPGQDDGWPPFTQRGAEFEVTRRVTPSGRIEIVVYGGGELIPLTLRIGGPDQLVVSRAANGVWALSDPEKVKALAGGRAVTAFREHIGDYERRLIAAGPSSTLEADPEALGFLLTGALLAALGGDPAAGPRARDLVMQRLRAGEGTSAAACVAPWRERILRADGARSSCVAEADRRAGWTERRALSTLCDAEFVAAFTIAETALAACRRSDQMGKGIGDGQRRRSTVTDSPSSTAKVRTGVAPHPTAENN